MVGRAVPGPHLLAASESCHEGSFDKIGNAETRSSRIQPCRLGVMEARDPPQLVGRYAIYGMIASGGMASVHFGRLTGAAGFSRTVAIKRLHPHLANDPEFRSTMIDEARLAARIHHPNVVPTLDIVAANGELLVVMEYVRGESLARLVWGEGARGKRVPLRIASAIAIGVLHGLHAAHEATSDHGTPLGIVHRDVSPQNILVGVDGVARVIDFGVAKAAGRLQITSEGAIKGKVAYMAPEQLAAGDTRLAAGEVTRAADVYAVGALFWEMLAGRRLFPGDSDARRALQVLMGAKDPPSQYAPDLPPLLDRIVMKALALDPADRFASAMEMAETLLDVVPPTFSTEVGKWVEEAAKEALSRRGAELARIESHSDATIVSASPVVDLTPSSGRGRAASSIRKLAVAVPAREDIQTVSSQPSTLSVEPPRSGAPRAKRSSRTRVVAALGGTLLLAAGVAVFVSRGAILHRAVVARPSLVAPAEADSTLATVPASVPPPPSVSVAEQQLPSAPPAPAGDVQALAVSAGRPPLAPASASSSPPTRPPFRTHAKSRAPKPSAPFRFADPD
jgi:serine/threonine protein kinase